VDPFAAIGRLRKLPSEGLAAASSTLDLLSKPVQQFGIWSVRRALGVEGPPMVPVTDPAVAAMDLDAVARRIHADLAAMLIGGVAALFLQSLHPLVVQGVVDHSDFLSDPLGRLQRTGIFLTTTTFGAKLDAQESITIVRAVHKNIVGSTEDGRPYSASDPELLAWVHTAEALCFARAYQRYGPQRLSHDELDSYARELAPVARGLGAKDIPESFSGLEARLEGFRPELAQTKASREIRRFLLRGASQAIPERAAYGLIVAAALDLLDPWARNMVGIPRLPVAEALYVRPAAWLMATGLRWSLGPLDEIHTRI